MSERGSSWREFMRRHWQPAKITPPQVHPELDHLEGAQRAGEVVRYSILSLEWWLSPNGRLREWLRLNGKVSSILLIPAVLVVPVAAFILWGLLQCIGMLVSIAGSLIVFPLVALVAAGVIAGVVSIVRSIVGK